MLTATAFYAIIWLRGALDLVDTGVLLAIFIVYMTILSRLPSEKQDPEDVLDAPPKAIVRLRGRRTRIGAIVGLFLLSGRVFVFISQPFVDSINTIAVALFGAGTGFFFIQWIPPFCDDLLQKATA